VVNEVLFIFPQPISSFPPLVVCFFLKFFFISKENAGPRYQGKFLYSSLDKIARLPNEVFPRVARSLYNSFSLFYCRFKSVPPLSP